MTGVLFSVDIQWKLFVTSTYSFNVHLQRVTVIVVSVTCALFLPIHLW